MIKIYQWLFALSFLNVLIAFWCIFDPFGWAAFIGVAPMNHISASLFSIWGGTLLGVHVLYIPGLIDPLRYQWSNWTSIALKFWMSAIFLSAGFHFYPFFMWDFTWGSVLLISWIAALNTRKEVKFMNA